MLPHKAGNLSTLTPEQLQARCEDVCLEEPKVRAYNAVSVAAAILYEAALAGNTKASKRLLLLAKEILQATGWEKIYLKSPRPHAMAYNVLVVGADVLYGAILEGNPEASKPLAHFAEEAIRAAGDKDL